MRHQHDVVRIARCKFVLVVFLGVLFFGHVVVIDHHDTKEVTFGQKQIIEGEVLFLFPLMSLVWCILANWLIGRTNAFVTPPQVPPFGFHLAIPRKEHLPLICPYGQTQPPHERSLSTKPSNVRLCLRYPVFKRKSRHTPGVPVETATDTGEPYLDLEDPSSSTDGLVDGWRGILQRAFKRRGDGKNLQVESDSECFDVEASSGSLANLSLDRRSNDTKLASMRSTSQWLRQDIVYAEDALDMSCTVPFVTDNTLRTVSTITVDMGIDDMKQLEQPLYNLAPVNRTLTDLEFEFRNMLGTFSNLSQRDIMSLQDERVRMIFEGVASSAHEPAVYRAFEVLFEDLYPLRVAARVIYKKLCVLIEESRALREHEVETLVRATGIDRVEVEACRLAFVTAAFRINQGAFLTKAQVISAGLLEEIKQFVQPGPAELLMQEFDLAADGKITFVDFMLGLNRCVTQECSVERQCDTLLLLQTVMHSIEETTTTGPYFEEAVDAKKVDHGRRYDEMLDSFRDWQDLMPQGKGRRLDVVRGCFLGAENEKIVSALRICYCDYSGLRFAAEIIYKLVRSLMRSRKRVLQKEK